MYVYCVYRESLERAPRNRFVDYYQLSTHGNVCNNMSPQILFPHPQKGSLQAIIREHPELYTHPFNWTPEHVRHLSCKIYELPPYLDDQVADEKVIRKIFYSQCVKWSHVQKPCKEALGNESSLMRESSLDEFFPLFGMAATGTSWQ